MACFTDRVDGGLNFNTTRKLS